MSRDRAYRTDPGRCRRVWSSRVAPRERREDEPHLPAVSRDPLSGTARQCEDRPIQVVDHRSDGHERQYRRPKRTCVAEFGIRIQNLEFWSAFQIPNLNS